MRLLDVLPYFTTSEKMRSYYLQTWYIWIASRVVTRLKTLDLRKLGNIRKVTELHRMIAQCPVPLPKQIFCYYWQKTHKKQKLNFSRSALFHMKTRVSLKYFVNDCCYNLSHWQLDSRCSVYVGDVFTVTLLINYNHGNNIVWFFDVLPNFPFASSETKRVYL